HVLFASGHGPAGAATPGADRGGTLVLAQRLLCNGGTPTLTEPEARRIVADAGLPAGHTARPGTAAGIPGSWESSTDAARTALDAALAQLSLPMLLGHLLTAAALGWLLHRGETALWRLVRISATTARAAGELMTVRALRGAVRLLRAMRHGLTATSGPDAAHRRTHDRAPRVSTAPLTGAATRRGPPYTRDELHLAA
ncbi:hypothetical protein N566_12520, partial [Streptomycetaceae bacterium MP113-05]